MVLARQRSGTFRKKYVTVNHHMQPPFAEFALLQALFKSVSVPLKPSHVIEEHTPKGTSIINL